MSKVQKVMFVPPGYSSNTPASRNSLCCNNNTRDGANPPCHGDCAAAMVSWAHGIYDWANQYHKSQIKMACKQHLDSRRVLPSDPSTFGAGGPNQKMSRIQLKDV